MLLCADADAAAADLASGALACPSCGTGSTWLTALRPTAASIYTWQRIATGKSRFVKFRYGEAMLAAYPEIRDRIYALARKNALRVDWRETTRNSRLLLLYDARQIVIARARVPLRRMDPDVLAELAYQLEDVFGEGWMN